MSRTFVGFGFGAIQSGLFLYEAFKSGNFDRLVVAEVMSDVVDAIRKNDGYSVNVASSSGIKQHCFQGLEIYNPTVSKDWKKLVDALAEADEIATALPSVDFYDRGETSVAKLLREGFSKKQNQAVVYTGENNNHAAEILEELVGSQRNVQFLNTVIGKMSGVVTDPEQIASDTLGPMTPASSRAFLVEQFNRILITQITLPGFQRGITAFEEKPDLLPFEEAKLYGHNATHALLGYLANERGCLFMSDAPKELRALAHTAFLKESGAALIKKYDGIDPLFTPTGFKSYVDDLMERMMNPYLRDQVERVIRDPRRKLGWNDRLIGTMRLCLSQGIAPDRFAIGARSTLRYLSKQEQIPDYLTLLEEIWKNNSSSAEKTQVLDLMMA
jgi:mannitol-1-phosphate 5-dehydrogenase